jgi:copper homeostasis protein
MHEDAEQRILEIACFSPLSANIAAEAGAHRIELCAGPPSSGGLTPSLRDLKQVKVATQLPVHVMIRPRAGDFVYTDAEVAVMRASMAELETLADGFVLGVLDGENKVDCARCRELVAAAGGKPSIFHRAVDEVTDFMDAVEQIAELGFRGVLTSGRKTTAVEGVDEIREAVQQFGGRLQIIVGGGVRASNIERVVVETDARWYHSSALVDDGEDTASKLEIADMLRNMKTNRPVAGRE